MFFRSQSISRLPATSLRLYCNSVPSTSSSTFYQSSASIVLSRRHNHTITPIHPQGFTPQLLRHFGASLAWIRGNRKDFEEAEEVRGARTKHTADSNSSSSSKGGPEPKNSMNKWLATALISALLIGVFVDFWKLMAGERVIPANAPQVDFATFAQKYLRAGEIKKIHFVEVMFGVSKVVGTLKAGTVIDGKPAKSDLIVISYARPSQKFTEDVRKEEAEMGIKPEHGVDIQVVTQIPPFMRVLSIGFALAAAVSFAKQGGILPSRKMNMLLEETRKRMGMAGGGPRAKHTVNDKKSSIKTMFMELPMTIIFAFALLSTGVLMRLFMDNRLKPNSPVVTNAPQVGFDDFIEKYLRAGEIRAIMLFGNEKALVQLKPRAYIDGKPAKSDLIVIKLHQPRDQFWDSVRREEAEMGTLTGVPMGDYNPYPRWIKFELFLWLFALLFLCQYGRRDMRILRKDFGWIWKKADK